MDVENQKEQELMNAVSPDLKQPGVATFLEIGQTGLDRWGQDIFEEFLPNLRFPRATKIYKEMSSNDPVIGAILLCARQLIRKATWRVQEASDSREDMEAAEFLKSCLDDMSTTWVDFTDELTSCFEYGWSYHEIVYKKRLGDNRDPSKRSKYNDGRIGWRKLPGRSQESWAGWAFDETNDDDGLLGMYQNKGAQKVLIPISKGLLFRTTAARNNPEGKSFLRNAYRPWYFKKHIEEIEGIGIERDLAGLPVLTTPENVDLWDTSNPKAQQTRTVAESLVRSIRRDKNEGVVLPFGWNLALLASSSKRQFDTNAIINRYDQRIAITLLADIIMLGADKVGSFALAKVKKSLLAAALDAQIQSAAAVINRYAVPRLFALNAFPGITDFPKVTVSPVDSPDITEVADYIQKLSGCNMPLFPDLNLENYLRSIANLPLTAQERDINENNDSENALEGGETDAEKGAHKGGNNS